MHACRTENPSITYSREGAGFTEFLQVEQTLPGFGVRAALARAGVAAVAAAEAERDARLWMLRATATAAVARLAAAQERRELAAAHAERIDALIPLLETREREGEGSRFDRLRAEQERRDARQQATGAAVDLAAARAEVGALLPSGTTLDRLAATDARIDEPAAAASLVRRAAAARAELRAIQQSAEHATLEARAARVAYRPAPTLFGGLKRADAEGGRDRGGLFGISVTVPLFNTGRLDAARWSAESARLDAARASLTQRITSEVTAAAESLALRRSALAEDDPAAGAELVQIAEVAYREGEVGILEWLDAIRTASRARLRSLELRLDARLAQIALERAVGEVLWP